MRVLISLTAPAELQKMVSHGRIVASARGFAIDGEEKNLGMRCIAAPVFDANGDAVAGISVSGPTSRVAQSDVDRLSLFVMAAARDLTYAIGGTAR